MDCDFDNDGVERRVIGGNGEQHIPMVAPQDRMITSRDNRKLPKIESSRSLNYKGVVELRRQKFMTTASSFPLSAGMQLSAEIIEGKRTVMEYLLSPVQRVSSEAGMER